MQQISKKFKESLRFRIVLVFAFLIAAFLLNIVIARFIQSLPNMSQFQKDTVGTFLSWIYGIIFGISYFFAHLKTPQEVEKGRKLYLFFSAIWTLIASIMVYQYATTIFGGS
jgi:hypothetical protein